MRSAPDFGKRLFQLKRNLAEGLLTPLRELLPDGDIEAAIAATGKVFRDRLYTPLVTFWAFLSQVLAPEKSCRAIVTRLLAGVLSEDGGRPSEDTGAYCRARKRLPEDALTNLMRATAGAAEAKVPIERLWHGRRVVLTDGTCVSMPETKPLVAEFGRASRHLRRGFPVAKIVALISLATGVVLDAAMGRFRKHERELYRELWRSLVEGDLIVGDRGFGSYTEIAMLERRGVDGLFRMNARRKVDLHDAEKLGHDDHLVTWDVPSKLPAWLPADAKLPEQLSVRVIKFQCSVPGFRTREITLVTTLKDPEKFPKEELMALYRLRWNIEINLRHIKSTLEMDVLRGLSPEVVRREIWMHFIGYNLVRTAMLQATQENSVDLSRISFKGTLTRIAAYTDLMNNAPICQLRIWYREMLRRIAEDEVPDRPDRIEPRCLKRSEKGYAYLTVSRSAARKTILRRRRA